MVSKKVMKKSPMRSSVGRGSRSPQKKKTVIRNVAVKNSQPASVTIDRTEYIGSYTQLASDFSLVAPSASFPGFDLNPGNAVLFPWLSNIAMAYEKYRFNSVALELVPGNSTVTTGRHYLAFEYDFEDPPATTAVDMMNNLSAVAGSMWEPLTLRLNIGKLNEIPWRFVSDQTRFEDAKRMIYAGYFMVGADNSDPTVFDLRIKYNVTLSSPCLPTPWIAGTVTDDIQIAAGQRELYPSLPRAVGLQPLATGVDCPNLSGMSIATGETRGVCYAVPAQAKSLDLVFSDSKAAATPSSYTPDTALGVRFFDALGTDLGTLQTLIATFGAAALSTLAVAAVADTTTWAVNGGLVQRSAHIVINELLKWMPQAAYIAPYLISTAGQTLTTTILNAHVEV